MDEMNMNFNDNNIGFDNGGYMPPMPEKSGMSTGLKAAGLVGGGLAAGVICAGAVAGLISAGRWLIEDGVKIGKKVFKAVKEAKETAKEDLPEAKEVKED